MYVFESTASPHRSRSSSRQNRMFSPVLVARGSSRMAESGSPSRLAASASHSASVCSRSCVKLPRAPEKTTSGASPAACSSAGALCDAHVVRARTRIASALVGRERLACAEVVEELRVGGGRLRVRVLFRVSCRAAVVEAGAERGLRRLELLHRRRTRAVVVGREQPQHSARKKESQISADAEVGDHAGNRRRGSQLRRAAGRTARLPARRCHDARLGRRGRPARRRGGAGFAGRGAGGELGRRAVLPQRQAVHQARGARRIPRLHPRQPARHSEQRATRGHLRLRRGRVDAETFHFFEQYRGVEGFEAHTKSPHFADWEQFAATELFTEPPVVSFYTEDAPAGPASRRRAPSLFCLTLRCT